MKALVLLIVSGILTAGVFIAGKQAGHADVPPLLVLFWQMSGGALVVWAVSWPSRRFPLWNAEHVRYYLIGGLLGVSLPYVLAFVVLRELQVGIVGLVTALSPVFTYALARLFGHEQSSALKLLGLVAGLVGVVLLVIPDTQMKLSAAGFITDSSHLLLALAIPVTLASSNIYRSRFWPAGSDTMSLVVGMLSVQGVLLFIVNLMLGNFEQIIPAKTDTGWLLLLLALIAGISYLSSFSLLRVGGPVYLSQVGYVITVVTLLAGIVLWDEQYQHSDMLSMALIFSGVLLTTWSGRKRSPKTIVQTCE